MDRHAYGLLCDGTPLGEAVQKLLANSDEMYSDDGLVALYLCPKLKLSATVSAA